MGNPEKPWNPCRVSFVLFTGVSQSACYDNFIESVPYENVFICTLLGIEFGASWRLLNSTSCMAVFASTSMNVAKEPCDPLLCWLLDIWNRALDGHIASNIYGTTGGAVKSASAREITSVDHNISDERAFDPDIWMMTVASIVTFKKTISYRK